uniref:CRAL-TRIO domain-containing protein n=1 Tax=Grammatophora oceanica TaxID=210454 RepID=A0A7S1YGP1_9STRA|mmetsp:Transcript_46005/g.68478  ORF Transcript_46005/g.68478 Transcript_46005/m.68478 type:complete len:345 (+) Transcript_46005:88-1122(+)|eukprot:CAMPEP_0194041572 /NCGR_PEP_ID=MMETSP0009_2-20130614/13465_1 /TAXON_ID=210454 /ORGANISM="Grammatophora oceanica, Strain CCMP 410" /LENGTH=344 /DNA_ID=CAMNT_0038685129 /DNA_START=88 /DNA_END=1122 /DNA_ORIENTATION=-
MSVEVSKEEAEKAQAQVADAASEEFVDAAEEEVVDGETFAVSKEELTILRAEIASEFPDDYEYLSDAYILSVASKPYSKDPTKRRPLDYSQEKLNDVMQWRQDSGASEIEEWVKLANGPETAPEAVENPALLAKAKAMVVSLNTGSIYFHGYTKEGKPILWLRTNRKHWYPDNDAECNGLIAVADAGIRFGMPPDVTDFVCIADSSYPPPPNPAFLIKLLKALVKGYPDRLHKLYSAPISSIVQFVMNLLLPLMPGRLASKVVLQDTNANVETLKDLLLGGEKEIPTFMGGTADHDQWYPEETKCPNRGQGTLKFDYFGMVERLKKAKEEYLEYKASQQNGDAK